MRRFIIATFLATIALLTPAVALAESCCVCKFYDLESPQDKETAVFSDITDDGGAKCSSVKKDDLIKQANFMLYYTCSLTENERCAPPTVAVTSLVDEFNFKDVVLGVTIPSLQFSPPPAQVDEEGNIYIPWIGEYIKAVYNFAVIVISILAVVMLIISGAQIISSAGGPAKAAGYKRITQAVIGLFIAWGSYVILYTINPNLTMFKSLKVEFIPTDPLDEALHTTTADTINGEGDAPTDGSPTPPAGPYTSQFPSCPIPAVVSSPEAIPGEPINDPRSVAFYNNAASIITATNITDKVLQIADAAAACGISMGACGRAAGTILTLAGVGDPSCLMVKAKCRHCSATCNQCKAGCWTKGKIILSIPNKVRTMFRTVKCNAFDSNGKPMTPMSNCFPTSAVKGKQAGDAKKFIYNEIKKIAPDGWPDSWVDQLQPGDYIITYNANSDPMGTHAALFVGFTNDGQARVIQSSYKEKPGKQGLVSVGKACIRSNCESPASLIEVSRPQ